MSGSGPLVRGKRRLGVDRVRDHRQAPRPAVSLQGSSLNRGDRVDGCRSGQICAAEQQPKGEVPGAAVIEVRGQISAVGGDHVGCAEPTRGEAMARGGGVEVVDVGGAGRTAEEGLSLGAEVQRQCRRPQRDLTNAVIESDRIRSSAASWRALPALRCGRGQRGPGVSGDSADASVQRLGPVAEADVDYVHAVAFLAVGRRAGFGQRERAGLVEALMVETGIAYRLSSSRSRPGVRSSRKPMNSRRA